MRRQRNLHYFKWIQSKFRKKEKIFVACLRSQEKLLIMKFYVLKFLGLAVKQRQRNPTKMRASPCTCRVISVLLVKTHWLNFLTFQKPPLTVNLTDSNYWMRLSRIWRILQIEEEDVIHRARRLRWITPSSSICRILHILRKPNSIIVLLFLQNNSKFKNKLKHANLGRCKFISIIHLYREV